MNTPEVNTQGKPRTAHQELGEFKGEWEMKTATLTAKVNIWLHEHLAMKTPIKLLGGLALGALVMAATALPFGTTYADEPARPLSSEQSQCYPELSLDCPLDSFLAEVLPDRAPTTGTSISGVQFEEWPEVGFDSYTYHRFMVEQGKVASRLSREQLELIQEYDMLGMDWRIDDRGRVVVFEAPRKPSAGSPVSGVQLEYWPEVGFDSYTYHRFMVDHGKVGRVLSGAVAEIDDVEAMAIYGYPANIFHALNEGKMRSRLSREQDATVVKYWPEVGLDSHTYHLLTQGKVGRPLSRVEVVGLDDHALVYPEAKGGEVSPVIDIGLGSNWDFLSDNQGKVVEVSPVIDIGLGSNWDFLSDNQGKVVDAPQNPFAGNSSRAVDYSLVDWEEMSLVLAERQAFSLSSIAQTECYPELDIC